ncbi:MAG: 3-deoxy-D-manno-octulosonic acid transferase [Caulobacter sp.]|nr:3-deoxy-D-manno-octulosonic acid transferase [Caulobacter sp.]
MTHGRPLSLAVYRLAVRLLEPFMPAILRMRASRGKEDPARLGERLGHASVARPASPLVWIHAVSVGESLSVLPLVERLRERRPDIAVLVTSGTVTSATLLSKRLPAGAIHQYAPLDTPGASRRFLDHWRPDMTIFVESEFWPNLILGAKARGAKLVLLSARITEKTAKGWARTRGMVTTVLKAFDLVLPQDRATQARLAPYGVGGPLVNLKYVGEPLACDEVELARLKAAIGARPVALAASTHPGEEALIASAFAAMPAIAPAPLLIITPRHPERGGEAAALLRGRGGQVALRSAGEPIAADTEAYVADTLGEMGLWFRLADVAVMGGSFVDAIGGHNPLEPARLGTPPVTGPFAFNFTDVYGEMLAEQAALLADRPEDLTRLMHGLLSDPARARRTGATARAFARSRSAALDDAWAALEPLLP